MPEVHQAGAPPSGAPAPEGSPNAPLSAAQESGIRGAPQDGSVAGAQGHTEPRSKSARQDSGAAPRIISAVLANGSITVTFDSAVDIASVRAERIHVRNGSEFSGGLDLGGAAVSGGGGTLVIGLTGAQLDELAGYAGARLQFDEAALSGEGGALFPAAFKLPGPVNTGERIINPTQTGPRGIAFSDDGLKMFVAHEYFGGLIYQYRLGSAFDVTGASRVGSVAVGDQEEAPGAIAFSADGMRLFVAGPASEAVHGYDLSRPFAPGTLEYFGSLDLSAQDPDPHGLAFSDDGLSMYVAGLGGFVHQYSLNGTYALDGAAHAASLDVRSEERIPTGLALSPGGGFMYITGPEGFVHAYRLAEPFEVSTATLHTSFPYRGNLTSTDVAFGGGKMFIGRSHDLGRDPVIQQYDLRAPYDIGAFPTRSLSVGGQDSSPTGVDVSGGGTVLVVSGNQNDAVYAYDMVRHDIGTSTLSDTFVARNRQNALHDVRLSADGLLMYTVGLQPSIVHRYNLSGVNDISDPARSGAFDTSLQEGRPRGLEISAGGAGLFITGTGNQSVQQYVLGQPYNISAASHDGTFPADDARPTAITFAPDGLRMYLLGRESVSIYGYDLEEPYNLSSAVLAGSFYAGGQGGVPQLASLQGLAFSSDGLHLFVADSGAGRIHQYAMNMHPLRVPLQAADVPHGGRDSPLLAEKVSLGVHLPAGDVAAPRDAADAARNAGVVSVYVADAMEIGDGHNVDRARAAEGVDGPAVRDGVALSTGLRADDAPAVGTSGDAALMGMINAGDASRLADAVLLNVGLLPEGAPELGDAGDAVRNAGVVSVYVADAMELGDGHSVDRDSVVETMDGPAVRDGVALSAALLAEDAPSVGTFADAALAGMINARDAGRLADAVMLNVHLLAKDAPVVEASGDAITMGMINARDIGRPADAVMLNVHLLAKDAPVVEASGDIITMGMINARDVGRLADAVKLNVHLQAKDAPVVEASGDIITMGMINARDIGRPADAVMLNVHLLAKDAPMIEMAGELDGMLAVLDRPLPVEKITLGRFIHVADSPGVADREGDVIRTGTSPVVADSAVADIATGVEDEAGPVRGDSGAAPTRSRSGGGGGSSSLPAGTSLGYDVEFGFSSGGSNAALGPFSLRVEPGYPLVITPMLVPEGIMNIYDVELLFAGAGDSLAEVYYNRLGVFGKQCSGMIWQSDRVHACDMSSVLSGPARYDQPGSITVPLEGFTGTLSIKLRNSQGIVLATHDDDRYYIFTPGAAAPRAPAQGPSDGPTEPPAPRAPDILDAPASGTVPVQDAGRAEPPVQIGPEAGPAVPDAEPALPAAKGLFDVIMDFFRNLLGL
ncbi:hypothetical protein CENSYa_0566 [Cenarchaeum symbiosum A]|uniref:Uncharacterized protein n=1 Tax=Cenarchaeum symbiosum (strain A) TaxID=414004 RepID=A0RV32_CENSY|nr:hypothetical protein CENSYa_0566 [Cenarchaeum symbiosum A]